MGILGLGLWGLVTEVLAYRMEQPQSFFRWDCPSFSRLNHYLAEIWNITNGRYAVDTITFNPNNVRDGDRGEMVQATFGGTRNFCINMSTPSPGSDWRCLSIEEPKAVPIISNACIVVENLEASDDNLPMGSLDEAVTVEDVWCTCTGSCTTTAEISLEDGAGNVMVHNTPTCAPIGTIPTPVSILSGGRLDAYESIRFDVDNIPVPSSDTYEICWSVVVR